MDITINKEGNKTTIVFTGLSLAGDSAKDFKEKAVKIIEDGEKNIALELDNTNFIDSSGVGKLLFLNKKLESLGGHFSITKINRDLYSFLESLAITKVIDVTTPV